MSNLFPNILTKCYVFFLHVEIYLELCSCDFVYVCVANTQDGYLTSKAQNEMKACYFAQKHKKFHQRN